MVHVIKVYLDDEEQERQIRRLAVGSDVVSSFQLLKEKIKALFQLPTVNFDVKWKDSENDEILMSSDGELAQALANADDGLLKLFISIGQSNPKVQLSEIKSAQEPNVIGEVHPHVVCDACNESVCGDRYKCLQCINFDLCSSCHSAKKHPYHDMIKLVKPSFAPREWAFVGSRKMWRSMFGYVPRGSFSFPSTTRSPGSTSSEENQSESAYKNLGSNISSTINKLMSEDFIAAEKMFTDSLGSFLQNWPGDIDVMLQKGPSKSSSKEFQSSSINKEDKKDVPTPSTSDEVTEQKGSAAPAEEKIEAAPPKSKETVMQEKVEPVQVCGIFAESGKTTLEVKETECINDDNEVKSSDTGEREKSPGITDDNSACAEGWTLLQNDEAEKQEVNSVELDKKEAEKMPMYPSLEKTETEPGCSNQGANNTKPGRINQGTSNIEQEGNIIHTNDPAIINALIKMQAMGFTNEGGWLERLLVTKKGNINEALDALYPFTRQ